MGPDAWKRRIGENLFNYVIGEDADPDTVAAVLTRLYEVGWRGPEQAPVINPAGTRVMWPTDDGGETALTSEGLERFYVARGHRFYLLRMRQLIRAMAGPLAPRLQEMFAAYEEQCAADNVTPLPEWADWNAFVGGENIAVEGKALLAGLATSGE